MGKLVECIPNFSVSKETNEAVYRGLVDVAKSIPGCMLFDVQSDGNHNRCVFTMVGSPEAIEEAVMEALEGLGLWAVAGVATIDLKKDEPGLLAFCRERGWPLEWYTAEELRQVSGTFTPSEFVRSVTGVDNVCERAALAGGGETLIIKKTARDGVTVAAAVEKYEVRFNG